ncbi:hypothetical protein FRC02_005687 [Tulasnella sp. 418]|nr:hypothetical protein FRC02_005687 [Tulasnella sp. 418]
MAAPIAIRTSRTHSHKNSLSFAGSAFAPWMCSSSSQNPSNSSVGLHSWSKHELMAISPTDMEFSTRTISSPSGTSIDDAASLVDVQKQHCTGYSCCNRQLPDMHALMDHCDQEHPYNVPKAGLKSSLLPIPLGLHIRPRVFNYPDPSESVPRLSPTSSSTDDDANFEIDLDEPPTPPPSGPSSNNNQVYIVSPEADLDIHHSRGHSRPFGASSETSILRDATIYPHNTNPIKMSPAPFLQRRSSATSDVYPTPQLQLQAIPMHLTPSTHRQQPSSQPLPQLPGQVQHIPPSASALVHLHQTLQGRVLAPSPSIDTSSSVAVPPLEIAPAVSKHGVRTSAFQPHLFPQNSSNSPAVPSAPIVPPTLLSTRVNSQAESSFAFQRPIIPASVGLDFEDEDEDAEGEDEDMEDYHSPAPRADEALSARSGFETVAPARSSPKRKASSKKSGGRNQRDAKRPRLSCPKPGCTKLYMNPNGLKYHLEKGTCTTA